MRKHQSFSSHVSGRVFKRCRQTGLGPVLRLFLVNNLLTYNLNKKLQMQILHVMMFQRCLALLLATQILGFSFLFCIFLQQ